MLSASCLLAAFASPASACLFFTSNKPFDRSAPETFQWDKAALNRALPAPGMKTFRIDRLAHIPTDYVQRIQSCGAGRVTVWIRWPRDRRAKFGVTGFRFKLLNEDSGVSVDDVPVTGVREGDAIRFEFLLFESPYAGDKPLVVKMEVYAVNARRQRGPASTLVLRAPAVRPARNQR